eukprot:9698094-Prorocentrum_lima.AAC.1
MRHGVRGDLAGDVADSCRPLPGRLRGGEGGGEKRYSFENDDTPPPSVTGSRPCPVADDVADVPA